MTVGITRPKKYDRFDDLIYPGIFGEATNDVEHKLRSTLTNSRTPRLVIPCTRSHPRRSDADLGAEAPKSRRMLVPTRLILRMASKFVNLAKSQELGGLEHGV